ncbi:MAG: cytochrome P450 [Pirellulales bacterium]
MLTTDRPPTASRPQPAATRPWPTVNGHWLTGCMRDIQFRPLELYTSAWREHGDFVRLRAMPGYYFFLLAHPDAIEHVLHGNLKNYRKPDSFNHSARLLAGHGILTSEGEFWRRQRRLVQPAFLRNSVQKLSAHMVTAIGKFVDEWRSAGDARTLDVVPEMMRLALRVASTTLLGTDISGEADAIGRAYRTAFEYVSLKMNARLLFYPLWLPTKLNREFRQARELLGRVVLELISRRRNGSPQGDALDLLLAAQDEESGARMTDEQLKDEALTLLTAGHETTGAALSWSWYLLAQHPDVQQAFHEQVAGHLQGRLPTAEDLASLPLATAIFEESMRLYPPAWGMPRETIEPDVICGYPVPAKATFILSQMIIHRHPDFWERPDEFDPTRFLPPHNTGRPKFAFFPFGGGPRICIGNQFAMIEGPLALAALAQRFHFSLVPNQDIVPDPTFTLRPKHGVQMVVRNR